MFTKVRKLQKETEKVINANFSPENRLTLEIYQWNLSVQRELPGNFAVTASYVGSGTSHHRHM
jgi:hypothetical protein